MKFKSLVLAGVISGGIVFGTISHPNVSNAASNISQTSITTTALNMRSTNSTKGKILTTLSKGSKVDVLQKMNNGWYQVKYNGRTGYVSGNYLTDSNKAIIQNVNTNINKADATLENKEGTTTANLNMRSENSTKGKVIEVLKKGEKVDVLQKMNNGWYQVKVNDKTGYVFGKYLTVTDKSTATDSKINTNEATTDSKTNTTLENKEGTTKYALNVRSENSTKGKVIEVLKKGEKVDVLQKMNNGWYQVKVNDKTGYVFGKYLTVTDKATATDSKPNTNKADTTLENKEGTTKYALNMRNENSTKGKVLIVLKKGEKVDVLQKINNGWYQVKVNDKIGYVFGEYLTVTDKSTATDSKTNTTLENKEGTTTANLNMRSENSTKGKVLIVLKKGEKVDVLQKMNNGWYQVKVNDKTGYVSGAYLTVTDKVTTTAPTQNNNTTQETNTNANAKEDSK